MLGISFLFWNLKQQPLRERIARMVVAHSVDVVIVAECAMQSATVSRAINDVSANTFGVVPGSGTELRLFTRIGVNGRVLVEDSLEAWLGFRLSVPNLPDLSLFTLHLPSKLRTTEPDRMLDAAHLAADIQQLEQQEGHERTIVVGDLNVNPFEAPVAWAGGLHGVMDAGVAGRASREIRGREYPMMYNPMWGVFGDRTPGPSGTYYRTSSESVNYFWNTYDQVLVRPVLVPHLSGVRVLDADGTDSLLTLNGLPDSVNGSDHLPLFFRLDW
jgi:hypothetical protein